jgi:hypothetical protein
MRRPAFVAAALAAVLASLTSTAAMAADPETPPPPPKPDAVLAGIVGSATAFVGFAVGATIMGQTGDNSPVAMAGWLTMEGGLALAPLTAHAVVGEWGRGLAFSALPMATTLGTIPIFLYNEGAVVHGTLPQQRWMYIFVCTDILASSIGVVDAVFAPKRALHIAPMVGRGEYGLVLGGAL